MFGDRRLERRVIDMIKSHTKKIVSAALQADGIEKEKILAAFAKIEEHDVEKQSCPVLVTQAEAARLASVSRFTIRKMTAAGKLHPVELLPGLVRYRIDELLAL